MKQGAAIISPRIAHLNERIGHKLEQWYVEEGYSVIRVATIHDLSIDSVTQVLRLRNVLREPGPRFTLHKSRRRA